MLMGGALGSGVLTPRGPFTVCRRDVGVHGRKCESFDFGEVVEAEQGPRRSGVDRGLRPGEGAVINRLSSDR